MPRKSLAARETILSRDEMRRRGYELSPQEEVAAQVSLAAYVQPLDLYNTIMSRTTENPLFLQRCLHYKLQVKNKRRIQLSVSVIGAIGDGTYTQSLFPFYVFMARPLSTEKTESSAVYRFGNVHTLTAFGGAESSSSARAKFVLPEISKLSEEVKSGSVVMLLLSSVDNTNSQGTDPSGDHIFSSSSNLGGYCLLGKIPMDLFHDDKSPNLSLGGRAETASNVSMCSCYMKLIMDDKRVSFEFPHNSEDASIMKQVPVFISAEEFGAKDISAYDSYSFSDVPQDSLPQILRIKSGKVNFKFKYYDDRMQETEVTENYTCAICLVKCASFEGLKLHLTSSHDLFRFEFWVNEDYRVVNVFSKMDVENFDFGGVSSLEEEEFWFCRRPMRRRKPKYQTPNANHVHHLPFDSDVHEGANCISNTPSTMLQFAKTGKLSIEQIVCRRSRALMLKRQFYHSHNAQPMAVEEVLADEDSEDEVDNDVADLEDKRKLDDFDDVAEEEKHMMCLWNSFIRRKRVMADAHIPWACEAFSKLHGQEFIDNPPLFRSWNLFMIKLWDAGVLDAQTINKCNLIVKQ